MQKLISHIQKSVSLSEAEILDIETAFTSFSIKKKQHLLEAGQICNAQYFILKGCVRSYIINEKGTEQTLQFAIENWWITDYMGFDNNRPSHFNLQATENSEVLAIDKSKLEKLLADIPQLERYFRIVLQKSFGAAQMRIKFLFTMSAEERFNHFNNSFPDFVQRIPQYMLATYLDFTPEFMSKIRAKKP